MTNVRMDFYLIPRSRVLENTLNSNRLGVYYNRVSVVNNINRYLNSYCWVHETLSNLNRFNNEVRCNCNDDKGSDVCDEYIYILDKLDIIDKDNNFIIIEFNTSQCIAILNKDDLYLFSNLSQCRRYNMNEIIKRDNNIDDISIICEECNIIDKGLYNMIKLHDDINIILSDIIDGGDEGKYGLILLEHILIHDDPIKSLDLINESVRSMGILEGFILTTTTTTTTTKLNIMTNNILTNIIYKCNEYAELLVDKAINELDSICSSLINQINIYCQSPIKIYLRWLKHNFCFEYLVEYTIDLTNCFYDEFSGKYIPDLKYNNIILHEFIQPSILSINNIENTFKLVLERLKDYLTIKKPLNNNNQSINIQHVNNDFFINNNDIIPYWWNFYNNTNTYGEGDLYNYNNINGFNTTSNNIFDNLKRLTRSHVNNNNNKDELSTPKNIINNDKKYKFNHNNIICFCPKCIQNISNISKIYTDLSNHQYINNNNQHYYNKTNLKSLHQESSTLEVQSNSRSPAVSSPPEVTTTSDPTRRGASSNYLSLKSRATPGDRGGGEGSDRSSIMGMMEDGAKDVLNVTSSGEPGSDLRELEGEVNKKATTASGMTTSTGPRVEPVSDVRELEGEVNRKATTASGMTTSTGPQVEPVSDLRELEGDVNRRATTASGRTVVIGPQVDSRLQYKEKTSSGEELSARGKELDWTSVISSNDRMNLCDDDNLDRVMNTDHSDDDEDVEVEEDRTDIDGSDEDDDDDSCSFIKDFNHVYQRKDPSPIDGIRTSSSKSFTETTSDDFCTPPKDVNRAPTTLVSPISPASSTPRSLQLTSTSSNTSTTTTTTTTTTHIPFTSIPSFKEALSSSLQLNKDVNDVNVMELLRNSMRLALDLSINLKYMNIKDERIKKVVTSLNTAMLSTYRLTEYIFNNYDDDEDGGRGRGRSITSEDEDDDGGDDDMHEGLNVNNVEDNNCININPTNVNDNLVDDVVTDENLEYKSTFENDQYVYDDISSDIEDGYSYSSISSQSPNFILNTKRRRLSESPTKSKNIKMNIIDKCFRGSSSTSLDNITTNSRRSTRELCHSDLNDDMYIYDMNNLSDKAEMGIDYNIEEDWFNEDSDTSSKRSQKHNQKRLPPTKPSVSNLTEIYGSQDTLIPMGPLPIGVYFDASRKLWRCQWRENGKFRTKGFSLGHHETLSEARRACIIFRCQVGNIAIQPEWLTPNYIKVSELVSKRSITTITHTNTPKKSSRKKTPTR